MTSTSSTCNLNYIFSFQFLNDLRKEKGFIQRFVDFEVILVDLWDAEWGFSATSPAVDKTRLGERKGKVCIITLLLVSFLFYTMDACIHAYAHRKHFDDFLPLQSPDLDRFGL